MIRPAERRSHASEVEPIDLGAEALRDTCPTDAVPLEL